MMRGWCDLGDLCLTLDRKRKVGMQQAPGDKETRRHGDKESGGLSLHGEAAARRQAITELLFFASVGDVDRCQKLLEIWGLEVGNQQLC